MEKEILFWRGRRCDTLTKQELYQALVEAVKLYEKELKFNQDKKYLEERMIRWGLYDGIREENTSGDK